MIYLLSQIIDKSAERFPDREAFRFEKRSITFSQLFEKTNQLAGLLVARGVRRGDRVGVFMNRSFETAIAIHGILKAGAAYVPLAPFAPPARTRFLLEDCGIRNIITEPSQQSALRKVMSPEVKVDNVIGLEHNEFTNAVSWAEVSQFPGDRPPDVRVLADDLAYVMYTSGTTGVPKGIMHTHYSGLSYAKLSADLYAVNETDRFANHAAIHFDISTFGYFSAPLAGAATVILSEGHTKFPVSLSKLMEDEGITIWYSVPAALSQLLQFGTLEKRDLNSLRWVLFGGEPFHPKHLRALMALWPQAKFSNVYGPAEVNQCTYYNFSSPPDTDDPIPLGVVWDDTEMIIVDDQEQPVESGEVGELLIRSATRMQGYWGQAELTRKAFYQRVRIQGCPEIFYRTGDLVRLDESGVLHFLGRRDRQIKTRGYRVELDEVEAALMTHPHVEEAAVFTTVNNTGEKIIEARVIRKNGQTLLDATGLQAHLQNLLPSYAIPLKIGFSDNLPRTEAGKIDRKELERNETHS